MSGCQFAASLLVNAQTKFVQLNPVVTCGLAVTYCVVVVKDEWMAGDRPVKRRRAQREHGADDREIIFFGRASVIASKPDRFALALTETERLRVADAAGQRDGLGEIHADFAGRVRVRAERDRHMAGKRELEQVAAGINFPGSLSAGRRC